jgi:hypothetical protein
MMMRRQHWHRPVIEIADRKGGTIYKDEPCRACKAGDRASSNLESHGLSEELSEGKKHHPLMASQDHTKKDLLEETSTSPTESYGRKPTRHIRGKHNRAGGTGREHLQQEPGPDGKRHRGQDICKIQQRTALRPGTKSPGRTSPSPL